MIYGNSLQSYAITFIVPHTQQIMFQCLLKKQTLQAKALVQHILQNILVIVYRYMDYWLPTLLLITFPIWSLPAGVFYLTWKSYRFIKMVCHKGNQLANGASPPLEYAILKGNGKYLKEEEDAFTKQFYDYTSRQFLSIGDLEPETKIVQIQCQSTAGLNYLRESCHKGTVQGLQSDPLILKTIENNTNIVTETDYDITGDSASYDCAMLFNFKSKFTQKHRPQLLKILSFCSHHISASGTLIYGDYFEKGEQQTFKNIFSVYNFSIRDQEDITRNMDYAQKLKKQIEAYQGKFVQNVIERIKSMIGIKKYCQGRRFIVYILEKRGQKNHETKKK